MGRVLDFFRRERLYILLLVFVSLVLYAASMPAPKRQPAKPAAVAAATVQAASAPAERPAPDDVFMKREDLEALFRDNPALAVTLNLATLLILAALCIGLLIDTLLVAMAAGRKSPQIRTYAPDGPARWGMRDVARVVILFLFFGCMLVLIESFLAFSFPAVKNDNVRMMANAAILDALAVIFIVYFSVGHYHERLAALGISFRNFWKNVFYGAVGYLAAVPVLMAVVVITAVVAGALHYVPEKQAVVQLFMKEEDTQLLFFTSLFAALAGPVVEEIFFRGFLYNALKKRAGITGAMLLTSFAFAALHAHPVGFLPIMIIGMVLAYLYEKTGTLVAPVAAHMIHNVSMVGFVFLIRQLKI